MRYAKYTDNKEGNPSIDHRSWDGVNISRRNHPLCVISVMHLQAILDGYSTMQALTKPDMPQELERQGLAQHENNSAEAVARSIEKEF